MTNPPQFGERAEFGENDVCYRHPDRHSFSLCQRCGRTICAECQTRSAVGVLCPDCVREAQPAVTKRAARSARVAARRVRDTDTPVVTYSIMIACALVYVAQLLSSWFGANEVTGLLWYAPVYSLPSGEFGGYGFEPWRMLTVMFTHSTGMILHILFNMYALWLFGPNLERIIGRIWFLVLYVFAGIGGSLGAMFWAYAAPDPVDALFTPTVGASGAIFGVLMATLVAFRAHNVNVTTLAVLIGINFAIGLVPGANISWQAHLGGMIVGAATMWVLLATRGPRKGSTRLLALIALALALIGLSFAYFVVSPLG